MQLSLLENALDFTLSAAEAATVDEPQKWKYAILHLVAGVELLLKARLQIEHWSLLFSQADKASKQNLASGDFTSVNFDVARKRLKNIADVSISRRDEKYLKDLRKYRNNIQHYKVELEIDTTKALIGKGISFVIKFYHNELEQRVTVDNQSVLERIHIRLREFEEFVSERMETIACELAEWTTVNCYVCQQDTLIIGTLEPRCLFCRTVVSSEDIAYEISEGGVESCPECLTETMAFILHNNDEGGWLCVSCGDQSADYERCLRCEEMTHKGSGFCYSCTEYIKGQG